jgi:hypothetical protein
MIGQNAANDELRRDWKESCGAFQQHVALVDYRYFSRCVKERRGFKFQEEMAFFQISCAALLAIRGCRSQFPEKAEKKPLIHFTDFFLKSKVSSIGLVVG